MSLEKKVHSWKIPQGFLKKLKDLTKNQYSEATSLNYPPQNHPKISLGDIHFQKGGYEIPNNMSHFLAELSLKNLPESHEFCAFGIHIEH